MALTAAAEAVASLQPITWHEPRDAYDVVLLSCQVAGTTGLQLLSLIRSFEHRKMTAVIMLTRGDEITDEALAAGADEVLVKPINPNALIWVVEKLVY